MPVFCVAKVRCVCFSTGNRFAQRSLSIRVLTFKVLVENTQAGPAGRNLADLVRLIAELEQRGVNFESLTDKIETNSPTSRLVFHVFAALARIRTQPDPRMNRCRPYGPSCPPTQGWVPSRIFCQRDQDYPRLTENSRPSGCRNRCSPRDRSLHPLPNHTQGYRLTAATEPRDRFRT